VLQRKISVYLANVRPRSLLRLPDLQEHRVYTVHEWRRIKGEDKLEFPALARALSIQSFRTSSAAFDR